MNKSRAGLKKTISLLGVPLDNRPLVFWGVLIIILSGLIAYYNSLHDVFVFDDILRIVKNKTIQSLSFPWGFLENTRRPFLYLTLALNYAFAGLDTLGYHLVNLSLHILSALVLWGILRQTFSLSSWPSSVRKDSLGISLIISLIWLVHPLQTQSVTYVIQRGESMMGLFYLLTLYCSIRYMKDPVFIWGLGAVTACLLGGLTKEVMVTAPFVVLMYDRTFVGRSFRGSVLKRKGLYAGLALTLLVMFFLLWKTPSEKNPTVALYREGIFSLERALTQPQVILHYLRLSFWPTPLVLDYGWLPTQGLWKVLPSLLTVLSSFVLSLWFFWKRSALGFVGLSFFLILMPSSSFVPLNLIFEHRMYLPLACVIILSVYGMRKLLMILRLSKESKQALAVLLSSVVVFIFAAMTIQRNKDYRSEISIWKDTVIKRPHNARARNNLGEALFRAGRFEEAKGHYLKAIEIQPDYVDAYINLGTILTHEGQLQEAKKYYLKALDIQPNAAVVYNNLGTVLVEEGRYAQAVKHYKKASDLNFREAGLYCNWGIALASMGRFQEAIERFNEALKINPDFSNAKTEKKRVLEILRKK